MVGSWLDLGCGFGRFLEYLEARVEEPDYIGYDSSADMVSRMNERFPAYSPRVFCRDIMAPINNPQSSILCSAVFIHLPFEDQPKILDNVLDKNPVRFAFNINCFNDNADIRAGYYEKRVRTRSGSKIAFRMTWQSERKMTEQVKEKFTKYDLRIKSHPVPHGRRRVVYMLRIKAQYE